MSYTHAQEGYTGSGASNARSAGHEALKFEMFYGWKECQRLGIPYVPETPDHSNVYLRMVSASEDEVFIRYFLPEDVQAGNLAHPISKHTLPRMKIAARKYSYPVELSDAERRRLRAAARRRNRKSQGA